MKITNQQEALICALYLALVAPTKAKARQAAALAVEFSKGRTPLQIEAAKRAAVSRAELDAADSARN